MSQINDALRRASNASRAAAGPPPVLPPAPAAPPPPPPDASEFPPPPPPPLPDAATLPAYADGEQPEAETKSKKTPLVIALVVVLAAAGFATFKFWKKGSETAPLQVAANEKPKTILPNASAIRATENVLNTISNRAAPAAAPVVVAPAPASAPVPAAVVPVQPPPKFPPLRLQSIFYRPANPSVMINGKTLFLDDEIQGVVVADIQPASVTLVLSGHTNVLTLR